MEFKKCPKCLENKSFSEFNYNKSRNDGLQCYCKECLCNYTKISSSKKKEYRLINKEKIKLQQKEYRTKNLEKTKTRRKKYYQDNKEDERKNGREYKKNNKKKISEYNKVYSKNYYQKNQDEIKENCNRYYKDNKSDCIYKNILYKKKRIKTDQKFRLNRNISLAIRTSLKGSKNGRHWEDLVGYTLNDLVKRLKATLPDGYTWDDFINGNLLHIDHIIPISVHNFKTTDDIDFNRCWALKNLRLLTAKENLSKGSKINRPFQPSLIFGQKELTNG